VVRLKNSFETVTKHIPLAKPIFDKEMEKAAVEALSNERFVLGESVFRFEEEFAKYCGVDYAVSVSSGTEALHIALLAAGIDSGQRVITSPASFVASANAIIHSNGIPVFSDIDLETYTLDPELLSKLPTKSKAVIPVHLYGYPADMDLITSVASKKGLFVIEDACQAHGASYKGKKAGSLADCGCFSFYSSKNMTVGGDGGMITTDDKKVAQRVAKLRDCGRKSQYVHDAIGYTSRLNTVNAAIGRVQLRHLDEWNQMRRLRAKEYDRLLSGIDGLILPPMSADADTQPVYHLYVVRTKKRDALKAWLESKGIACGVHYVLPIHLQPVYMKMFGYKKGMYPKSEELCRTCLSLPMYPDLSSAELSFISNTVHDFFEQKK
jgi:perosamine synthetase